MRSRSARGVGRRFSVHLAASAALLAAASTATATAATAAVSPPVDPPQQQVLFPAGGLSHYAWRSWEATFAGRSYDDPQHLTWPDASIWAVGPLEGGSGGPYATDATTLDPWAGTVSRRRLDDRVSRSWVVAVDRREWALRDDRDGWPGAELVERDVRGQIVAVHRLPRRTAGRALVPTRDGLRIVATIGRSIVLLDARMRRLATWHSTTDAPRISYTTVGDAEPLKDGSVVVQAGEYREKSSTARLIRLAPARRSRAISSAVNGALPRLVRAADGIIAASATRVITIDDGGRVRARRWMNDLEIPGCGRSRSVDGGGVATNGRAMFTMLCQDERGGLRVALELDGRGRVRATYALGTYTGYSEPILRPRLWMPRSWTTLPDGGIPAALEPASPSGTVEDIANGWITWKPESALESRRGSLRLRLERGAGGQPSLLVRVTCAAPYGQRCSGVAQVRARGELVGSVRYSLPGRPGRAAARDELPVALSADAETRDLKVTALPLPPRPVLTPARPDWDGSIPYSASALPRS